MVVGLLISTASWAESNGAQTEPPTESSKPSTESAAVASATSGEQQTHTVEDGDTLWDLSTRYFSSPWRWNDIWDANRDAVGNPHWIYPGQTLIIPPIRIEAVPDLPPELAAAPAFEPPPVPFVPPPEAPPEMPVMKLVPPKKIEPPALRVIPSLDKPREIVYQGLLGTGFITEEEYEEAPRVLGTMDGRRLMGQGDVIYLEFEESPTVQKGEKYLVVRVGEEIEHPDTGDDLGYRIEVLGSVEIEDTSTESASARVLVSYDYIATEDLIVPMQTVPERVLVKKGRKGIEGYVVAAREDVQFLGQGHIVYTDLGAGSGAEAGQVFKIVRSEEEVGGLLIPPVTVGEIVILRVGSTTSTALIVRSNSPVQVGDKIRSD
ncbi:MAG: LysM peptidoglycan-binding domain-containing protein [Nitrospirae bacterium]|nr:LysM peptidoglycan-binding domain-containing protein [Nitrospirota bacterium]